MRKGVLLLTLCGGLTAADPVSFKSGANEITLSNGLCRIVWAKVAEGWSGAAQINVSGDWKTLGVDGMPGGSAYEVLEQQDNPVFRHATFADEFRPLHIVRKGRLGTGLPIDTHGAFPTNSPKLVKSSPQRVEISWEFTISAGGRTLWNVAANYALESGMQHALETVKFTRVAPGRPVRVRRVWHITGIPHDLISSSIRSVTQVAWRLPHGTFMVLATRDGPWTPYSGGGGTLNWTLGNEFQQFIDGKLQFSPDQAVFHQAPPCLDKEGWLELGKGETYSLKHYIVMHPAYTFSRTFIDYMRRLQPLEHMPPRYSWRYFVDKCLWTLRYTPEGYDDHGDWGLYWKDWYNLTKDPASSLQGLDKVHSLDWGASWDIWNAYFLLLYARRYNDPWALQRYQKVRNGIVVPKWQVQDPESPIEGAFWMELDDKDQFHISNWMSKKNPRTVWVCDAAKVGYFLVLLWEKTGDTVLLDKAKRAAEFLLRVRKEDGDLRGSAFADDGSVVSPSNLGGTVSPVLLWSRLYRVTKDRKYLDAAVHTADFSVNTWLSNDHWQTFGGEIDSFEYADSTSTMYAAMALSELAIATGEEKHREYARKPANHLVANMWLFDINWGYYRKEARWNGMDERTAGSLQGWIRPECTMAMYLASKATHDPLYQEALEAHGNWMTHMQYDNPDSPYTFGGGHEVLEIPADHLNGFGANFWPETVGQGVALLEHMDDLDRESEDRIR